MSKTENIGKSKTYSKLKDLWATPQNIVNGLFKELTETGIVPANLDQLDVCASEENTKCAFYISEEMNMFETDWGSNNLCWLNPPYSNVMPFIKKAVEETRNNNYTVALLKNDCSTKWFAFAVEHARAVIFITHGRIGFLSAVDGRCANENNFSSVVFLFSPEDAPRETFYWSRDYLQKLGEENE